jgi:mannose-6-phosphate isomerase-like protein (cupin superfamily)
VVGDCRAGRGPSHPRRPALRRDHVRETDEQTPHTRDELYVVAQGSGTFVNGDRRHPFTSGDVLFVPAGAPHRFEDFSDDFGTWVIFYGPEGGERPR